MNDTNPLYSHHIFLFPFRWERDRTIDIKAFIKAIKNVGWEYKAFSIPEPDKANHCQHYNEFVFFYEFARDAIYNTTDDNDKTFYTNNTCYQFNFKVYDSKYQIKTTKRDSPYELKLNAIKLKLYNTGIAILSFHMDNDQYVEMQDIKNINEFGRRTYPQYLPLDAVRDSFLPEFINITETNLCLIEDYSRYKKKTHFDISVNENPADLPQFIKNLLGDQFSNKREDNKIFVDPIIDDRMFTICWYGNNEKMAKLSIFDNDLYYGKNYAYNYETNPFWYEYIFIDAGDATCQSKIMRPELIKKHTYDRWIDYQTIYGITRYSLMALSNNLPTLETQKADFILPHIQTMYFQLASLALAQRASILNFSIRATEISNDNQDLTEQVTTLYKDYIQFKNKMFFNEVTAQEQGIEMYEMLRQHMKIKENNEALEKVINDLHHYANLKEQKEQTIAENRKADETQNTNWLISMISLYFLFPTFITGVFGMNIMNNSFLAWHSEKKMWVIYLLFSFVIAGIIHFILCIRNKYRQKKKGVTRNSLPGR